MIRAALFTLVLAMAAVHTPALHNAITGPDAATDWRSDCDRGLIHDGLLQAPRLVDTLRWWTGPWVGQVPFWRPLTSLGFWLEWKAFGWERQVGWQVVHGLSHLLVVALLLLFVERLSGSFWIGVLAAVVFAWTPLSPAGKWITTNGLAALHLWKNSPDLWMTACLLGAAIAAWDAPRRGSRHAWLAAGLALAACGFKETGFVGALLVLALAVYRWRHAASSADQPEAPLPVRQSVLTPLLVFGLLFVLAASVKWHSTGVGYVLSSNVHLGQRLFMLIAPRPIRELSEPIGAAVWMGAALASLLLWPRRRWTGIVAIALVAVAMVWEMAEIGQHPDTPPTWPMAASNLLEYRFVATAVPVCAWLYGVVRGWSVPLVALAVASACLLAPAAMAPQVGPHAYYAGNAIGAGAIAVAWSNVWVRNGGGRVVTWLRERWGCRSLAGA